MKTLMTFWLLTISLVAFSCDITPKFSYRTKGLTVSFNNKSLGDYSSVLWDFGDGITSTETNPSHLYEHTGMHFFSLTVANETGCRETFEGKVYVFDTQRVKPFATPQNQVVPAAPAFVVSPTDSPESQGEMADVRPAEQIQDKDIQANKRELVLELSNAPNPFTISTTVSFDLAQKSNVAVSIYDYSGRLVRQMAREQMWSGRQELLFEREDLPTGTYLIDVQVDRKSYTHRMAII